MAQNIISPSSPSPTANNAHHLHIQPPPPSSTAASQSNPPFTPRSTTLPDGFDSDSEFDVLEPTPIHSPGGPHYEDLPPTYDEAQQQALHDARNGIPPLDPSQVDRDLQRMTLNEDRVTRDGQSETWEYRAPNPNATAPGQRNVPVHQINSSEQIPVGRTSPAGLPQTAPPDPATILLNRALEFTHHEPDADVLYAPRLSRCIAIPQQNIPSSRRGESHHRRHGRDRRRQGRGRGSRDSLHIPGQWPESMSSESLQSEESEKVQFLRAYAKPLHAHSIRPAEFVEFLDGLNALCLATNSSNELLDSDSRANLIQNYIKSTNEAFFAPRGLKVSLQSFSSLLQTLKIPEERGQRAGAIASVLDTTSSAGKRAQALHPWVEALDTNVPSSSAQMLLLREMGENVRKRNQGQGPSEPRSEKPRSQESEHDDPPHSLPEPADAPHHPEVDHGFPGWGGWGGRGGLGGRGRCGGRGAHRGHPWTPFGPPGHGPFGAPGGGPFGGPGRSPFGPPGHGPFGRPGHRPFGNPGHGPFGPTGNGPFAPLNFGPFRGSHMGRGPPGHGCPRSGSGTDAQYPNNWAAWGENIGKWGEAFGKRVEDWGQQFGRQAEDWGRDFGNRAEAWGDSVSGGPSRTQSTPDSANISAARAEDGNATRGPEGLRGQETGVERPDINSATMDFTNEKGAHSSTHPPPHERHPNLAKKEHDDDDDDADSIFSSDSDSSSDSESDEEAYPDTHAAFLSRIHSINEAAEMATQKGKKRPEEVAQERALAIERATQEKTLADLKIAEKRSKRETKKAHRATKKAIRKEHRRVKRELRAASGPGEYKNTKRSKEWREAKNAYKERKKELRQQKQSVRKEWREARMERKRMRREGGAGEVEIEKMDGMVWVVVENLGN